MKFFITALIILSCAATSFSQRVQRSENGMFGLAVMKSNGNVKWLAKPKYIKISPNKHQTFLVCDKEGKWGVITNGGKEIIKCDYQNESQAKEAYEYYLDPSSKQYASNKTSDNFVQQNPEFTLTRDYSAYIRQYVEQKINAWQKKGEFEKTSDYRRRVTEAIRKEKIVQLTNEVCDECLRKVQDKELRMTLGEYDADNETFLISSVLGNFVLPVAINKAPAFKSNWKNIISENSYDIVNGKIILRSAQFSLGNKVLATYSDTNHALYAQANVQYNFDPIEIPTQETVSNRQPLIARNTIQIGKSDVDVDIPTSRTMKPNTFALIFANENYREEVPVSYAGNDGRTVSKYFTQTLGIPSTNIHLVEDATKNDMVREIEWLKQISNVYDDIDIMVYYAGHGCPDESSASAFLIPVDGSANSIRTLYPVAELYRELGELNSKRTILFMDACFSGAKRGSGMLASARGVALKAKTEIPQNNMIVLSAAQGDETAWPYDEKGHGLFTYFLLKKLQESKGNVTIGQLSDYVIDQVEKRSIVINSKKQTPSVSASPVLGDSWNNQTLK